MSSTDSLSPLSGHVNLISVSFVSNADRETVKFILFIKFDNSYPPCFLHFRQYLHCFQCHIPKTVYLFENCLKYFLRNRNFSQLKNRVTRMAYHFCPNLDQLITECCYRPVPNCLRQCNPAEEVSEVI